MRNPVQIMLPMKVKPKQRSINLPYYFIDCYLAYAVDTFEFTTFFVQKNYRDLVIATCKLAEIDKSIYAGNAIKSCPKIETPNVFKYPCSGSNRV